ncbi:MAG: hypothetical protein QMD09_02390 [Desulfatibacillaceae bacterium]|nr:hypothetical protein [Desulfatibacillaceae bacterium]
MPGTKSRFRFFFEQSAFFVLFVFFVVQKKAVFAFNSFAIRRKSFVGLHLPWAALSKTCALGNKEENKKYQPQKTRKARKYTKQPTCGLVLKKAAICTKGCYWGLLCAREP